VDCVEVLGVLATRTCRYPEQYNILKIERNHSFICYYSLQALEYSTNSASGVRYCLLSLLR
jgi:hypothetical protein